MAYQDPVDITRKCHRLSQGNMRKMHRKQTPTRQTKRQFVWSNQLSFPQQDDCKVSKGAKIRNRYNQVPHLTQNTNGKVAKLKKKHNKATTL